MTDALRDLGTLCAALAAIVGLILLVAKLPPLRWIFRHLVSDPFSLWFRAEIREEIDRRNGGTTLMDRVVELDKKLDEHTKQDSLNFKALEDGIAAITPQEGT